MVGREEQEQEGPVDDWAAVVQVKADRGLQRGSDCEAGWLYRVLLCYEDGTGRIC